MSILYLLIPLAVLLVAAAVAFFIWSVKSGQFDDMEGPAHRILWDDDEHLIPGERKREGERPEEEDTRRE